MISLTAGGQRYTGWLTASVYRSLDAFAHSFEFTAVDRWAEQESPRPIRLGDPCTIFQDDVLLITGYVDELLWEVGPRGVTLRVSGRSKTADLVDCAAVHKTGQWINAKPLRIMQDLAEPFGINIEQDQSLASDTTRVRRFDLEDGESAFDAIEKLARLRGWLPTTTAIGTLRLTQVGNTKPVSLRADRTIRRTITQNSSDRFSIYRVRTQTARWDAETSPRQAALSKIQVQDSTVPRYRPTVLYPEHGATVSELEAYATWMRNTRIADSERITYEMPGTLASSGEIWDPGQLVNVRDDQIGINTTLVIASTRLRVDANGETTELLLTRPEAYTQKPIPEADLIRKLRKR